MTSVQPSTKISNDQATDAPDNPYAGRIVVHSRLGVWDLYEEHDPDGGRQLISVARWRKKFSDVVESFPYVVRMVKDVLSIPGCKTQLCIYLATELGSALVPAASIWRVCFKFQGRLLQAMEDIKETTTVDAQHLVELCMGRIACTIAGMALRDIGRRANRKLNNRVRRWHIRQSFEARARLDLPTFGLKTSQNNISRHSQGSQSIVWRALHMTVELFSTAIRLGAQTTALVRTLRGHSEELLLTYATMAADSLVLLLPLIRTNVGYAYAVTTKNADYIKMKGWEHIVTSQKHRKELVAGNLANWADVQNENLNSAFWEQYFSWIATHLPEISFTIRAIRNPAHLPEFLARLNLVQTSARGVVLSFSGMVNNGSRIEGSLDSIRQAYEVTTIENVVSDGAVPFRINPSQGTGVALEFRSVSFKYRDAKDYALRNVSFTLLPSHLCVIVGSNGAGKSTILKLAVRLYDPYEGEILLGGRDIRTLKVHDVRQAISVLFQDYTHFPLSVRDNIALGDPSKAHDDAHVREAARLGGAESFIEKLPEGFETYLKTAVRDMCHGPKEGNMTSSGNPFDFCAVRHAAGIKKSMISELSGGQMQRLAVARTFMRCVVAADSKVGLVLFDEPSASLDPVAEHDLFNRLRDLRGSKTMIFSSHRFGNLTRHADLILYMEESGVVESGTHDELLERQGKYNTVWQLQAQAFVA